MNLGNLNTMQSPELPWWLVISLRNHYRIMETFVETGTGIGATSKIAATFFERVFTVEIDPEMHRRAKENLRGVANVQQYKGDSAEILPHLMPNLSDKAIWWLDGHYSGGPKIGKVECPLLQEIEAINSARPNNQDCILIDNIGMMTKPPHQPHNPAEWPTIQMVVVTLQRNPKWSITRFCDVLIATPDPIIQTYNLRLSSLDI